jgi:subtilisin family serine protease
MHRPPTFLLPRTPRAARANQRCLITLATKKGALDAGMKKLKNKAGIKRVVRADDFHGSAMRMKELDSADAVLFPKLGYAVVYCDHELCGKIAGLKDKAITKVHSAPRFYMLGNPPPFSLEYLRGYRDAVNHLYDWAAGQAAPAPPAIIPAPPAPLTAQAFTAPEERGFTPDVVSGDEGEATWGLQITGVMQSTETGAGIKIALLDTGIDQLHPDFGGRSPRINSFIADEPGSDRIGHGTHCAGTIWGNRDSSGRRIGIAPDAELFVGKVLGGLAGFGEVESVFAGIEWALDQGCDIVSMSLGSEDIEDPQRLAELGQRADKKGCLLIAAAGNNADRENSSFGAVENPANGDAVLAVAALDRQPGRSLTEPIDRAVRIWNYSAASSGSQGGRVDIAAPGAAVYSAWPGGKHFVASGTSMATPHVAGIAALWAEKTGLRGKALWQKMIDAAQPLNISPDEVGAGLVMAPAP